MEDDEDIYGAEDDLDFAVKPGASSPFAVKAPSYDDIQSLIAEQRGAQEKSLRDSYDAYAKRIMAQRLGPSKKDMFIDALATFAQPTRTGRIGESLANVGAGLAATRRSTREGELAREDALAKAAFDRDTRLAELNARYGAQGVTAATRMGAAAMKGTKPEQLQPSVVSPTGVAQNPFTGEVLPPGVGVTKTGRIVKLENLTPEAVGALAASSPAAVPGPPAPPAGESMAVGPAAVGTGAPHRLGEQWRGEDGALYQQNVDGPKKIGEPSPDFEANKAGKVEGSKRDAVTSVDTKVDLQKAARDVAPIVAVVDDAKRLLTSGNVITGIGAKQRLVALKAAAMAGDKDAAAKVSATEQFINATSRQLATIIKQFGSGTAISDSDRRMAEKIAGSDITLEKDTLDWILGLSTRLNAITMKAAVTPEKAKTELQRRKRPSLSSFESN